jgi:hypothetical protein
VLLLLPPLGCCAAAAGLELDKHTIIEIACLITDTDLQRVWEVGSAGCVDKGVAGCSALLQTGHASSASGAGHALGPCLLTHCFEASVFAHMLL